MKNLAIVGETSMSEIASKFVIAEPNSNVFVADNTQTEPDFICQWVYNKRKGLDNTHRHRIGYIIAGKTEDGTIVFGWSKCSRYDSFDLERAREIACGRLYKGSDSPLPESFRNFMPEFLLRCAKYFQTDKIQEFAFYN